MWDAHVDAENLGQNMINGERKDDLFQDIKIHAQALVTVRKGSNVLVVVVN